MAKGHVLLFEMLSEQMEAIGEMALEGIVTAGDHHKLWYLQQILLAAVGPTEYERLRKQHEWDDGIPP